LPNINDGIDLLAPSNGTGFPDFQLTGLNASNLTATDQYAFFMRMTNTNDGPDSFFIVASVAAVPGPIVGAGPVGLAAAGLFGLNFWRRRRNGGTLPA
jgi:MYXO-CTERM domain-containing protein